MTEIYLSYSFPTKVSCFSFFSRKFVFDMNFFIKSNVHVQLEYHVAIYPGVQGRTVLSIHLTMNDEPLFKYVLICISIDSLVWFQNHLILYSTFKHPSMYLKINIPQKLLDYACSDEIKSNATVY